MVDDMGISRGMGERGEVLPPHRRSCQRHSPPLGGRGESLRPLPLRPRGRARVSTTFGRTRMLFVALNANRTVALSATLTVGDGIVPLAECGADVYDERLARVVEAPHGLMQLEGKLHCGEQEGLYLLWSFGRIRFLCSLHFFHCAPHELLRQLEGGHLDSLDVLRAPGDAELAQPHAVLVHGPLQLLHLWLQLSEERVIDARALHLARGRAHLPIQRKVLRLLQLLPVGGGLANRVHLVLALLGEEVLTHSVLVGELPKHLLHMVLELQHLFHVLGLEGDHFLRELLHGWPVLFRLRRHRLGVA
mmetsp:Transcript_16532/g.35937  ORF Transcript_16532/g.35937 Transcript_16532/m.35937 type:complete len:305 (+) Transcript_16532:108-1022(+)